MISRLLCTLLIAAAASSSHADIFFSLDAAGGTSTTITQSDNQSLPIFINSDASDSVNALVFDFNFPEMLAIDTSMSLPSTGNATQPGFFGDGNIELVLVESTMTAGADTVLNTSFELANPEIVPATPVELISLNVDASNLPIGDYTFAYDQNSTGAALIQSGEFSTFPVGTETLNFSVVTAVPEPSSLLACSVVAGIAGVRRRRRRRFQSVAA